MSKRGDNIWHRHDGRWCARYVKDRKNGRAIYGYLYGKTYGEVKAKREALWKSCDNMLPKAERVQDFAYFCEGFLLNRRPLVKPSTLERYRGILKSRILPYFMHMPPAKIKNEQMEQYADHLRHCGRVDGKGGLSEKSIRDTVSLVYAVLHYAAEQGCPSSVTRRVTLPKTGKKAIDILTKSDQSVLEQYVLAHLTQESLGILLALYTGLRIGELCALRWRAIDLEAGLLRIEATLQRISVADAKEKTMLVIDKPKSDSSERAIPIPQFLSRLLLPFRTKEHIYLLTGRDTPTEPRVYYRKYRRLLFASGLPDYTFHALRHTFATRAVESGFDNKSLSELLGHASVRLTLERYVHPSVEMKRACMEKLTPLLSDLQSAK